MWTHTSLTLGESSQTQPWDLVRIRSHLTCPDLQGPAETCPATGSVPHPIAALRWCRTKCSPPLKFSFSPAHSVHSELREALSLTSWQICQMSGSRCALTALRIWDQGFSCHNNELPCSLRLGSGSRIPCWVEKRSVSPRRTHPVPCSQGSNPKHTWPWDGWEKSLFNTAL